MATRSKPAKPLAQEVMTWLRQNLGRNALGALTGTDTRALLAAVYIVQCYAYSRDTGLLDAFRIVVLRMQPTTRELAYHATACLMDWHDRAVIWEGAGLPALVGVSRCEGE